MSQLTHRICSVYWRCKRTGRPEVTQNARKDLHQLTAENQADARPSQRTVKVNEIVNNGPDRESNSAVTNRQHQTRSRRLLTRHHTQTSCGHKWRRVGRVQVPIHLIQQVNKCYYEQNVTVIRVRRNMGAHSGISVSSLFLYM